MAATQDEIVDFWVKAGPDKWFGKDEGFDATIRRRFLATHEAAGRGELVAWQTTAAGSLALLILLDQFPRNMFRGTARAFATDPMARAVAGTAIAKGFDRALASDLRGFFYLPFMHSEDGADQQRCVALYEAASDADGLKYARHHRDIVTRFGRFPHRNAALGRETTSAEQAYLDADGFKG